MVRRGRWLAVAASLIIMMVFLLVAANTAQAGWRRHNGWHADTKSVCRNGMIVGISPSQDFALGDKVFAIRTDGTEEELNVLDTSAHGPAADDLPASFADDTGTLIDGIFIADYWIIRWEEPSRALEPGDYIRLWDYHRENGYGNTGGYVQNCRVSEGTIAPTMYRYGNADTDAGQLPVCGSPSDLSTIYFPADLKISDVDVSLYVSNIFYPGHERATLMAPSGTEAELFYNIRNGNYSLGTRCDSTLDYDFVNYKHPDFILDDDAKIEFYDSRFDFDAPGYYKPTGYLRSFNGESSRGTWTLSIKDEDTGEDIGNIECWCLDISGYRKVSFTQDSYYVSEGDGEAVIEVALSETSTALTEVSYQTEPKYGSKQPPLSGTWLFPPRENFTNSGRLSFTIPIVDDGEYGQDDFVKIKLSDPTNQYVIGDLAEATIRIIDDDFIPHDDFDAARVIDAIPFRDDLDGGWLERADDDPSLPCVSFGPAQGFASAWYAFTPDEDGDYVFGATDGATDDEIGLAIWQGTRGNLTSVDCYDYSPGFPITTSLAAGETYYIETFSINPRNMSFYATKGLPDNDDFGSAKLITALPYNANQNVINATTSMASDPTLPCHTTPGNLGYGTVWYVYTPDRDMQVSIDTIGSNYDTILALWQGTEGSLTNIACNDNEEGGSSQSQLRNVPLVAGKTYYIEAAGSSSFVYELNLNVDIHTGMPPDNDDFNNATPVAMYSQNQLDVRDATAAADDPLLPCGPPGKGNGSVWYQYTPEMDTLLRARTWGNYDTVLAVWQGSRGSLSSVACDYRENTLIAYLPSIPLSRGVTYYIEVAAYDATLGDLVLNISRGLQPVNNDTIADALPIATPPFSIYQDGYGYDENAPDFPEFPNCGGDSLNSYRDSVWFKLEFPEDTMISANTFFSNYDTILAVWSENFDGSLSFIHCNDDATLLGNQISGGYQSMLTGVQLTANSTYYIEVTSSETFGYTGSLMLNVSEVIQPENDEFADPTAINSFPFTDSRNVMGATTGGTDPVLPCFDCDLVGHGSVWYAVTPADDSLLSIDTAGSGYDTILAIWQGTEGDLSLVDFDEQRWLEEPARLSYVPLTGGVTYYIEVATFDEVLGRLELKVDLVSSPTIQDISLNAGWNLISSFMTPADPALTTVLDGISGDLALVKNGAGEVYWPAYGVNQIGSWDERQGYQVYMNNPAVLAIEGIPVDPQSLVIDLPVGWNMIAYLHSAPMPIDQALADIVGDMVLVKDGEGQVYWPTMEINDIVNLQPGLGYQIFLNNGTALTYPANGANQQGNGSVDQPAPKPKSDSVRELGTRPIGRLDAEPVSKPKDKPLSEPEEKPAP